MPLCSCQSGFYWEGNQLPRRRTTEKTPRQLDFPGRKGKASKAGRESARSLSARSESEADKPGCSSGSMYHSPSRFSKPNLYWFKLWLLPTLMWDAVGWVEIELLLWHLLCIGNGAEQQKAEEHFLAAFVPTSKPESQAVASESAEKRGRRKLLLPLPASGDKLGRKADDTCDDAEQIPTSAALRRCCSRTYSASYYQGCTVCGLKIHSTLLNNSRTNTKKRCPFYHRGLECNRQKSGDTWSNRQVWPWSTKWSRAKANSFAKRTH